MQYQRYNIYIKYGGLCWDIKTNIPLRFTSQRNVLWAKMDSNHRRRTSADLQSAPFGHSGICPYLTGFYLYFFAKATIFNAVTAYSSPLFPSIPPERSSACSWLFVVRSPNTTGISSSALMLDMPPLTAWHM